VAKVGAYDSRFISPNPDAARPGDTMITLTEPAIQLVDHLQQPLALDASQAETDAAQLIQQLNSLGPMATQVFIQHYGTEIEALKADLTAILTAQQEQSVSLQTQQMTESTTPSRATTVFARVLTSAQADALQRGRKAGKALAREHQIRQR